MENESNTKLSNEQQIKEDINISAKGLENIPNLFQETNNLIIKLLQKVKKYDINNIVVDELIKKKTIFTIENYKKKYSFFCSQFFLEELENILKNINIDNIKNDIEKDLQDFNKIEKEEHKDSEIFQKTIEELKREIKKLKESENLSKERKEEIEKLRNDIDQTSKKLNETTNEFVKMKEDNIQRLNVFFGCELCQFEEKLKKIFNENKVLEGKENELLFGFYKYKEEFSEATKFYEKENVFKRINDFNLDDLNVFIDKELKISENKVKDSYQDVIKLISHFQLKMDFNQNKELIGNIEKQKKIFRETNKAIDELKKEEKELSLELADMKNKYNNTKAILSQKTKFDLFREQVINLKNLTNIFLSLMLIVVLALIN